MTAILLAALLCADPDTCHLPALSVTDCLPPHQQCREHSEACEAYYSFMLCQSRNCLDWQRPAVEAATQDALYRAWAWYRARHATDPAAGAAARRGNLQALILQVGWRAVLTGMLPTPFPLE